MKHVVYGTGGIKSISCLNFSNKTKLKSSNTEILFRSVWEDLVAGALQYLGGAMAVLHVVVAHCTV